MRFSRFQLVFLFLSILIMGIKPAFATHIVGGEIFYTKLTGNEYEITMKLYRDCYNGVPDFDSPAYVYIYNQGNLVFTLPMDYLGKVKLPIILTSPCLTAPSNVCVEESVYKEIVNLPPAAGGYDIVYQRCCRNQTILNIVDPGDAGSSYYAHIPGTEITTTNSSPSFNNFPPLFLCTNTPIVFDHSATDTDGDSLVYEFCAPYYGASTDCPIRGPGMGPFCPEESPAPPYTSVQYNSGYSATNPFNASPALNIDPVTGDLTGTPTQTGQYVVGVCVSEYRNGVLLSINKRDFQFNILSCSNAIASIPEQTVFCDGFTVQFGNQSVNSTSYYWDFGDSTTTSDVSTAYNPTYTYSDSGTYTVMLISKNQNINCVDTAYSTFKIQPLLEPDFTVPPPMCLSDNNYSFTAGGSFTPEATFLWTFNGNAFPDSAIGETVNNIVFDSMGQLNVTLTASQFGCSKSISKPVTILPGPLAKISSQLNPCQGMSIDFGNESQYAVNYSWDFGVSSLQADTSSAFAPTFTYPDTGTYTIQLIAADTITTCIDTAYASFQVLPLLDPDFTAPGDQCFSGNSFSFNATGTFTNDAEFFWDFGSNASTPFSMDPSVSGISYNSPGTYNAILTVYQYGCEKEISKEIIVVEDPVAEISLQTAFCEGFIMDFKNSSQFSTLYYWDFGVQGVNTDTSFAYEPTYTYPDSGKYTVTLVSYNDIGCSSTDSKTFLIYPLVQPVSIPQQPQCITGNSFDFFAEGTFSGNAEVHWEFGPSASDSISNDVNPQNIYYDTSGTFFYTLHVLDFGCEKSFSDSVIVHPTPTASFKLTGGSGCYPITVLFQDSTFSATPLIYIWNFGDGTFSDRPSPQHTYSTPGVFDVSLMVYSMTGCTDSILVEKPEAVFAYDYPVAQIRVTPESASQYDPQFEFTDASIGSSSCIILFGDGNSSDSCSIIHSYQDTGTFRYTQIVMNESGCTDSIDGVVKVTPEYRFHIPNAFTPNGDGKNDFFFPVYEGVIESELLIFNRWGQLIFQSNELNPTWDGKYRGEVCQQEVYNYILRHKNVFNKRFSHRGFVTLLR